MPDQGGHTGAQSEELGARLQDDTALEHEAAEQRTPQQRAEALQATIREGMEALSQEMAAGRSEQLARFLDFAARFHTYSPSNQILIAIQCPEASRIAGYKAWQHLGYHVARGQRGIRIFAPNTARIKDIDPETGEERITSRQVRGFRMVSVFDVSQLNKDELAARPLPVFFRALGDDPTRLAGKLQEAIEAGGIRIVESIHGTAEGWSAGGTIGLKPGLDPVNRAFTLIHEYAHEILHHDATSASLSRQIKERHAEAVAYIVARHFGLHNPFSADYVLSYGASPQDLFAEYRAISLAASRIIQNIESLDEKTQERGRHTHRRSDPLETWKE